MSEIDTEQWLIWPSEIPVPSEKETITPTLPYKEKLVAFIDILGVREKVREAGDEAVEIVSLMRAIRSYVDNACNTLIASGKMDTLQIGDGFFIVSTTDCIDEICEILSAVQWQVLTDSRMLLRGVGSDVKSGHQTFHAANCPA